MLERLALSLVVVALLVSGCGGDDQDAAAPTDPAGAPPPPEKELARNSYEVARDICAESGVTVIAQEFQTQPNPEDAAQAYADAASIGGHVNATRDGCLAGFAEHE